ncbi:uncharacterized protein LOC115628912 [Scaptodrosophila lebanonensis]|uniref:Uncharacterized protein LOC115628912 n=1 Tax=Drosophila lebanonensis TaxID=7225 RepID=A0A6J2TY26_DROLE|nr:uncharacterized protein LOC115628912 [Scaptodrosophila lebanonensis]XP_030381035.1 uncharacterized protein LOC115628912 [Scaptodrosophila lebanonensis]
MFRHTQKFRTSDDMLVKVPGRWMRFLKFVTTLVASTATTPKIVPIDHPMRLFKNVLDWVQIHELEAHQELFPQEDGPKICDNPVDVVLYMAQLSFEDIKLFTKLPSHELFATMNVAGHLGCTEMQQMARIYIEYTTRHLNFKERSKFFAKQIEISKEDDWALDYDWELQQEINNLKVRHYYEV